MVAFNKVGNRSIVKHSKRSLVLREPHNVHQHAAELALCANFALKSKGELHIFSKMMKDAKIAAVRLGKLPENDPVRMVEGNPL